MPTANNDHFRIQHNDVVPQKGYVLIAEPFLDEIYFQRSVIFLTNHDKRGSMGFVLNKRADIFLQKIFPEVERDVSIFLGGPVGRDKLFFLHTLGDMLPDALHVQDDIYLNGDFSALCNYLNSKQPVEGVIKFLIGYSGWSGGQLEAEIEENTWAVNKLTTDDMLRNCEEELWKESLSSLAEPYRSWRNYPKEPYLN
ncbi:MAG: YqgE/AlgH family protein [Bacteroidales bacterium]|jgi:putative transcriptional regulator|nr:YqgE/AlgH family protein [Bacteroidales bacterium]